MGDLKIIETSTEQEVFLELKDNFFEIVEDEKSGLAVLRHKQTNQGLRKIFSWKSQWDYLLTANWTKRIAYILPRDKIPADWWNASVSKEHELKMLEGFEECFVDLRRDDQMVRDIEKVLNTTRTRTGSMRAQNAISIDHSTHEPFDEIEDDLGSDGFDLVSRQRWSTSGFRRGFGSAKHSELRGETYAVWVSEVLIELCRAR